MPFSYCFKITSSVVMINLPYAIVNSESLKVNFCSYKTASANQKLLVFKITGFDTNYYYDGTDIIKYTKIIALPPSTATPIIYENTQPQPDVVVPSSSSQTSISSLRIETTIDHAFSSDISPSNPIYLELTIY